MTDWALVASKGDAGPIGPDEITAGAAATPGLPVHSDSNTGLWSSASDTINVSTAGVERLRVDPNGNVGLNATSFGTSAAKVLGIGDGTAPSTSPASMVQLYSESGNLRVRDAAGTITQLSAVDVLTPGGRLGLRTGFAQNDVELVTTNAQTLYYQPYMHDRVNIWNGSLWVPFQLTYNGLSLSLSGLTTTLPYDIYVFDNSGTLTLQAVVWTGTTGFTRGTFQGMPVKGSDARFLYLGTIQMQATSQCEDSYSRRFVWNYFNKVAVKMQKFDSTATWNYTTASYRAMNNSNANRIEVVSGDYFSLMDSVAITTTLGGAVVRRLGIGLDSVTTNSAQQEGTYTPGTATNIGTLVTQMNARYQIYLLGYHFLQAIELGGASVSFQGSGTGGSSSGIQGSWMC